MLTTRFTELVGCTVPLQLAGMGELGSPRLAAAVSVAGGLGMIGLSGWPTQAVIKRLDETRHFTSRPFGANFIVPSLIDEVTKKPDPEVAGSVEASQAT